jgi:UDP-3-O-[3-hydroxymyristoyl] N-acetylglucosamine deacetylase
LPVTPRPSQKTIVAPAIIAGVGVHTGDRVRLAMRPAARAGIVFVRTDITDRDNRIPVSGDAVVDARLNTMIENAAGVRLSTIEHLMAAFCRPGRVERRGRGRRARAADPGRFGAAVRPAAGPRRLPPSADPGPLYRDPGADPYLRTATSSAALLPCDRYEMRFEIDFDTPVIGNQVVDFVVDEETFRSEIMAARTFGFAHEVEALRKAGLARGGSLENAVVIDGDQILNPGGLRMEREFVRTRPWTPSATCTSSARPCWAATKATRPVTRSTTCWSAPCWPIRRAGAKSSAFRSWPRSADPVALSRTPILVLRSPPSEGQPAMSFDTTYS